MRRMYSKKQLEEMIANGKVALEVANVKQLNDAQCELLKAGDLVEKVDNSGKHTYIVTFKKDKAGLCLTYFDASCIETQSYDFTAGHWVYNSQDKGEFKTDAEIKSLAVDAVEEATSGTVAEIIGLDSSGNMVKGSAPSGGGDILEQDNVVYGTGRTIGEVFNTLMGDYSPNASKTVGVILKDSNTYFVIRCSFNPNGGYKSISILDTMSMRAIKWYTITNTSDTVSSLWKNIQFESQ